MFLAIGALGKTKTMKTLIAFFALTFPVLAQTPLTIATPMSGSISASDRALKTKALDEEMARLDAKLERARELGADGLGEVRRIYIEKTKILEAKDRLRFPIEVAQEIEKIQAEKWRALEAARGDAAKETQVKLDYLKKQADILEKAKELSK